MKETLIEYVMQQGSTFIISVLALLVAALSVFTILQIVNKGGKE